MRFSADDLLLMAIVFEHEVISTQSYVHSRYRKLFYAQLTEAEKRRRQRQIPRCALLLLGESAWGRAYNSESDQAMITLTGLDCATFMFILSDFEYYFENCSLFSKGGTIVPVHKVGCYKGRPRFVKALDALGLVLVWTRMLCSKFVLEVIFGMTQTCVSDYLSFSIIILISILHRKDDAKIL